MIYGIEVPYIIIYFNNHRFLNTKGENTMDEKRYLLEAGKYRFILYTRDNDPIHDKTYLAEFSDKELTARQIIDVLARINTGHIIDPDILQNKTVFRRRNVKRYIDPDNIYEYTYIEYELYEKNGTDIKESATIHSEIEISIRDGVIRFNCFPGDFY